MVVPSDSQRLTGITAARLLGFNMNTVQRPRPLSRTRGVRGFDPDQGLAGPQAPVHRSGALGRDSANRTLVDRSVPGPGRAQRLALVIDCQTREWLGWHLSRSGRASTALEHALINRFGT